MSLLVLVAHSGRTLALDVQPNTRVDAVQQALVSFTGVPIGDQIVMANGVRLDAAKALAAYKLPAGDPAMVEDCPVFLYCRSYLRPGAAPPQPESMQPIVVNVPPQPTVNMQHPLHSAASPMLRVLPDYELQFQHQLSVGRLYWDASQMRMQRARQLLSEQEVQARAADAARANVEAHYAYICNAYQDFMARCSAQRTQHMQVLATFHDDLAALASVELHPFLQTERMRRLVDLAPVSRLREWAEHCRRSHEHFGSKVLELEQLMEGLQRDVEALFMQAPSVDLDRLGCDLSEAEGLLDEQGSIVQVLAKDLRTVKALVEEVVQQLGSQQLTGGRITDACTAMESIHASHSERLMPRLRECDAASDGLLARCMHSKARMAGDVVAQLQRISAQQSKIRDMKNKLAAFGEVLTRQGAAFAELRIVTRLPCAYRALLSECARRRAWHELFTAQGSRLADHMARLREKEAGRREGFVQQVERYLPSEVLARAGVSPEHQEPPRCQVTVPSPPAALLPVTAGELQRLVTSLPAQASSQAGYASFLSTAAVVTGAGGAATAGGGGAFIVGAGSSTVAADEAVTAVAAAGDLMGAPLSPMAGESDAGGRGGGLEGGDLGSDSGPISMPSLELENARLRAELAAHIAATCVKELQQQQQQQAQAVASLGAAGSAPRSINPRRMTGSNSGVGSGVGTPSAAAGVSLATPAASTGTSPPTPSLAAAAAGVAAQLQQQRQESEAVAALQKALLVKDELMGKMQQEAAALAKRCGVYEQRITELEALVQSLAQQQHQMGMSAALAQSAAEASHAAAAAAATAGAAGEAVLAASASAAAAQGQQQPHQAQQPAPLALPIQQLPLQPVLSSPMPARMTPFGQPQQQQQPTFEGTQADHTPAAGVQPTLHGGGMQLGPIAMAALVGSNSGRAHTPDPSMIPPMMRAVSLGGSQGSIAAAAGASIAAAAGGASAVPSSPRLVSLSPFGTHELPPGGISAAAGGAEGAARMDSVSAGGQQQSRSGSDGGAAAVAASAAQQGRQQQQQQQAAGDDVSASQLLAIMHPLESSTFLETRTSGSQSQQQEPSSEDTGSSMLQSHDSTAASFGPGGLSAAAQLSGTGSPATLSGMHMAHMRGPTAIAGMLPLAAATASAAAAAAAASTVTPYGSLPFAPSLPGSLTNHPSAATRALMASVMRVAGPVPELPSTQLLHVRTLLPLPEEAPPTPTAQQQEQQQQQEGIAVAVEERDGTGVQQQQEESESLDGQRQQGQEQLQKGVAQQAEAEARPSGDIAGAGAAPAAVAAEAEDLAVGAEAAEAVADDVPGTAASEPHLAVAVSESAEPSAAAQAEVAIAQEQMVAEVDDEDAPDIDDVLDGGPPSPAAAATAGRQWPAAGSGLGASGLGVGSSGDATATACAGAAASAATAGAVCGVTAGDGDDAAVGSSGAAGDTASGGEAHDSSSVAPVSVHHNNSSSSFASLGVRSSSVEGQEVMMTGRESAELPAVQAGDDAAAAAMAAAASGAVAAAGAGAKEPAALSSQGRDGGEEQVEGGDDGTTPASPAASMYESMASSENGEDEAQ